MSAAIDAALAGLDEDAPDAPSRERCASLLAELARAIEANGVASFVGEAYLGLGRSDPDELAFLIAVHSIVRDDQPSYELDDEQRERAWRWHLALVGLGDELRAALAIPSPTDEASGETT
jgi:hypothetical protein